MNQGYGGALISGILAARHDWIFYTDGDAHYRLDDLPKLAKVVDESVDVVNGYKVKPSDSWYRRLLGSVYQRFFHLRFRFPIRDVRLQADAG